VIVIPGLASGLCCRLRLVVSPLGDACERNRTLGAITHHRVRGLVASGGVVIGRFSGASHGFPINHADAAHTETE
jgi:hypothetical protein